MSKYVQIKDIEFDTVYQVVDLDSSGNGILFYFPEQVLCNRILKTIITSTEHSFASFGDVVFYRTNNPVKIIVSEKHRSSIFKELYE